MRKFVSVENETWCIDVNWLSVIAEYEGIIKAQLSNCNAYALAFSVRKAINAVLRDNLRRLLILLYYVPADREEFVRQITRMELEGGIFQSSAVR